jgi:protein OS-9
MSDTILFVKETKTCHYVLVIHTPRLCGLPGFKSAVAELEQASIRCREIVTTLEGANKALPEAPYPFKVPPRQKAVLPPPPATTKPATAAHGGEPSLGGLTADTLKKALGVLTGRNQQGGEAPSAVVLEQLENGDYVMQLVDEDGYYDDDYDYVQGEMGGVEDDRRGGLSDDEFTKFLKAAGYDVTGPKSRRGSEKDEDEKRGKKRSAAEDAAADDFLQVRDEL